jgi:predicted transcriptional regulator
MRRDALSLKIAIMEALRTPMIITHIMCTAKINGSTLKRELKNLTTKNLVTTTTMPKEQFRKYKKRTKTSNHPHYILTPQGTEVLNSILKARIILMEPS